MSPAWILRALVPRLGCGALALVGPGVGACDSGPNGPGRSPRLVLERVVDGLERPLYVASPPGDDRLFIVEQGGPVLIVKDGRRLGQPFLDLTSVVSCCNERGLLSIAFHPDYAANGRFFVDYTDRSGDTQIVEYQVSADPDLANPGSARTILSVGQPFANHNGGLVVFGPDRYLYIGLGDGGSGGDPFGNGQSLSTLLGKILRIDVDGGSPYAIPADNPFVGVPGARPEIWAYGLRNPWRFSFGPSTGDLYIADVGQDDYEEVNVSPVGSRGGENYGWDVMEGLHCFGADSCDPAGLTLSVLEYDHTEGCSVTGGYVYRGSALPALSGVYFYADFCAGWVRSFRYQGGAAADLRDWTEQLGPTGLITSFGEDADGELYITTEEGSVFRIVPAPR